MLSATEVFGLTKPGAKKKRRPFGVIMKLLGLSSVALSTTGNKWELYLLYLASMARAQSMAANSAFSNS